MSLGFASGEHAPRRLDPISVCVRLASSRRTRYELARNLRVARSQRDHTAVAADVGLLQGLQDRLPLRGLSLSQQPAHSDSRRTRFSATHLDVKDTLLTTTTENLLLAEVERTTPARQLDNRTAAPPLAVRVRGLVKRYGDGTEANRGIDLDVRRGEVVAILGPN